MQLNNAQIATLRAAIDADPVFSLLPRSTADAARIAGDFNKNSSPAVIVWRSSVSKSDVLEQIAIADLASRTDAQRQQLLVYMTGEVIPCDRGRVRAAFDSIFSSTGTATRLLALWKRTATRAEALYATGGDGSDAVPHRLGEEGYLDAATVERARA